MIVVVSCGAAKQDKPAPAGHLYTGSYARQALTWARSVAPTHRIFILSALYGLVPHDQVISPYERRMTDTGAITVTELQMQAARMGIDAETDVVVVGGRAYRQAARAVWPHVRAPFNGGMGTQMGQLRRNRGVVPRRDPRYG
jgi:hypothetical protein